MVCAVQYVSLCQEDDQFTHFHQSTGEPNIHKSITKNNELKK